LWVPRTRSDSRSGQLRSDSILAKQAAEPVATAEEIELRQLSTWRRLIDRRLGKRRPLIERAVGPMRVVVLRVFADHVFEVAAADNQQSVEALAPNASDPALGVRPRLRRLHRRCDHPYAFGAEDLIEVTRELAVAITDEKPRPDAFVAKLHQQVARLLGHPAAIRVGRDPGQVDAPGRKLDEKEYVEALQEERIDGEEVALQDARRLSPQELAPVVLEPLRRRLDPRLLQNRPDGARGELDPKPDQLALDPPIAPARALASEPHHERTHLGASRWASGTPMRIRPAAGDQLAMPAHKGRWRHEQRRLPRA